jgi:hypothetical protein
MGGEAVRAAVQLPARAYQPGQAAAPLVRNGDRPPGPPPGRRGQVPRGQRPGGRVGKNPGFLFFLDFF